jgi:UDP-N-acetylglucosamine acyltransferase
MSNLISKYADIDANSRLGSNVTVGPFCVIGPDVEIGDDTVLSSHVVIKGKTKIGKGNRFFQFSSVGDDCQDKKYHGEPSQLIIGDYNIFRENTTVHRGTEYGGNKTVIGSHNLFMVGTHIAHDCIIEDHVVFSNGASLAGHVVVGKGVNLGGFVGVHQFCEIGAYSFAAGGSIIIKDVLPYTKVSGYPARAYGLNLVGLERAGFTSEQIEYLRQAYKIVFRESDTVKEALRMLENISQKSAEVKLVCDFLEHSSRGIIR